MGFDLETVFGAGAAGTVTTIASLERALARIHALAMTLGRAPDLATKLDAILRAAADLHDTQCGLLSVHDPMSGTLEPAASFNFPRSALDIVREITPSPTTTQTACGSAFIHRERTIVEDTETDPRFVGYRRIARNVGFRAVHSTPIYTREGALLGVLSLHLPNPGRPSTLQIQISEMCAQHAADAIEAARAHERLSDLADNMSQHAWIADDRGTVAWFNRQFLDYTGAAEADVLGWGWTSLFHPDHVDRIVMHLGQNGAWDDTFPLRGKDGTYRWFLASAKPIRDAKGRVVRWFGTHTDITEQREIQSQLESASRAKDHFLAALSHELRTPLSPILLAATALERDCPPAMRPKLSMIRRNVELETRLIDDLLDLSRIASGKVALARETSLVAEAVDDVLEIVKEQIDDKDLQVTFSHDGDCIVLADPARLRQILWNVVKNAAKFTPEGGSIAIRAECSGEISRVTVRDSGIGIAPDAIARVFEAFEQADASITRQFGGLGLGLAITKRLVEMHGGTIVATSEGRDRGATFTIELPHHRGPRAVTARPVTSDPERPIRLLVVDDHADTAEIVAALLDSHGYETRIATTAKEALALAAAEPFDLLVSDVGLPDLSGYELLAKIRMMRQIPAIAMSGWGRDQDRSRSIEAGFADHLRKPIALPALAAAIQSALGK